MTFPNLLNREKGCRKKKKSQPVDKSEEIKKDLKKKKCEKKQGGMGPHHSTRKDPQTP